MKKYLYPLLLLFALLCQTACNKYETYADLKKKENEAISRFITKENIKVIDEATFKAQGQTTSLVDNEYVRFTRNGVYMQIVRKGSGSPLEDKKTTNVLCRFMEKNLLTDSVLLKNDETAYISYGTGTTFDVAQYLDKMTVTRSGNTFTASFTEDGMMYTFHGSTTVPAGWLVPLSYVNVSFPITEGPDAETASVRLIVPHSQGTADASSSVYPCYYEITYQRDN